MDYHFPSPYLVYQAREEVGERRSGAEVKGERWNQVKGRITKTHFGVG